jgi:hypothetical protein
MVVGQQDPGSFHGELRASGTNQSSIRHSQIRLIHQPNFGALGVNRYVNSAIQRKILPAVTKEERFQSVAVPEPTLVYG